MSMHEFAVSYADLVRQQQLDYDVEKDSLTFALQGYATALLYKKFPNPEVDTTSEFGIVDCELCQDSVCSNHKDDVKERFTLLGDAALYAFEDGVKAALSNSIKSKEAV